MIGAKNPDQTWCQPGGLWLRSRPVCWWAASHMWRRWGPRSGSSSDLWGFLRGRGLYGTVSRGAKYRPRSGECSRGQKTARPATTPARCPSMESVATSSDTCRTRVGNGEQMSHPRCWMNLKLNKCTDDSEFKCISHILFLIKHKISR